MKNSLKNALRFAALAVASAMAACTSPNQPISEGHAPSPATAAEMALMATHDSLMFETNELYTLKAQLAGSHTEAAAPYIHGLLAADQAMLGWMHQYKAPDSTATPAARLAYFQQQQQVLAGVRRQYRATLDSATRYHQEHPAAGEAAASH